MFDKVVKGGTIYTAVDTFAGDIGIRGEKIAAIGRDLPTDGAEVIDAAGKCVIPGVIDVHVHLQLPFCGTVSSDDFETGTRAAACGGVTTVIDYAMQGPHDNLKAGFEARRAEADGKVCVDYSLHGGITGWKRLKDPAKALKEMVDLGVPTYKMFMIYEKEGWQSDDADIFAGLLETSRLGGMILIHAESERVMNWLIGKYLTQKERYGAYAHALSRPHFIEEEAIQRACKWAEATGGTLYVVHMGVGEGADTIRRFQQKGANVYAETCPQYLLLNDELFKDRQKGHWYATAPQIKRKEDNERLWKALQDGEVCVISTDTCTFTTKQKAMWDGDFTKIPLGMPGVQTLFPAAYTFGVKAGRFSLNHLVALECTNPARIMGMYPRKGTIALGSDADLAIFDPNREVTVTYKELAHNCDWSPFEGWKLSGFPETTICRGTVVVKDGKFVGKKGYGKFIPREPYGWKGLTAPWAVRPAPVKAPLPV